MEVGDVARAAERRKRIAQDTVSSGSHRVHEREAEQAVGGSGAEAKVDERSPGGNSEEHPLVLEDKTWDVEIELLETRSSWWRKGK